MSTTRRDPSTPDPAALTDGGALPDWLPSETSPTPDADALLKDPLAGWIVRAGAVELQLAELTTERVRARWTPLLTAGPGTLICGVPPGNGRALVARAQFGTELTAVRLDALDPDDELVHALDEWLRGGLRAVRSLTEPGEAHPLGSRGGDREDFDLRALAVARAVAMRRGEIAQPAQPLCWVTAERGRIRVLGRERNLALAAGAEAVLGDGDWVLAESDAVLRTMTTAEVIAAGRIAPALEAFGAELRDTVARRLVRAAARERAQIAERELRDETITSVVDADFAAILDSRVEQLSALDERPVFAAMHAIGQRLQVSIRTPEGEPDNGRIDLIASIARASRLRSREVTLGGKWWRRDVGPLIGFLGDEEVPVALLPREGINLRGGYVMQDPDSRRPVKVDRKLAARIGESARQFYQPFPERPLTGRDLLQHGLRGARGDIALLMLSAFGVAALGLLVPLVSGRILGRLVPKDESKLITTLCMLLLLSATVSTMLASVFGLVGLRLEGRLDHTYQSAVWDRLMSLPVRFFRQFSTGELATAALGISEAREIVSGLALKGVLALVVVFADFVLICFYDLRLALLTIVIAALTLALSAFAAWRMLAHQQRAHDSDKQINSRTFQIIAAIAKISTAAAEPRAYAHWARAFAEGRRNTYAARLIENRLNALNAGLTLLAAAAAFWVVIDVIPALPETSFIVFNVAFFQVMINLLQVSSTIVLVVEVVPSLRSLRPILQTPPEVAAEVANTGPLSGAIEAQDVTFSYSEGDRQALTDVSFKVSPGEFLGIVGPSGCGKSTLMRLLLGFETPQEGTVSYDGHNLAGLDPLSVRRQCGVVLQNATLFAGDILSNIVGSGLYTQDEAWDAVRLCGLDEEIEELPMGMFTMLSDGGGVLSGGQRQRLLLARAFVSRPRILLLDEATSALDNHAQRVVADSMEQLRATRIVIAHRVSTIERADRIVVLDEGRIVQEGTYESLLEQDGGLFAELVRRQVA